MKVPDTGRKKSLFIIDAQPAFIKPHNKHIIQNIANLINQVPYDLYIETTFHAEKGSFWDQQQGWTCPMSEDTHTVIDIANILEKHKPVKVLKETRSVFKAEQNIMKILEDNNIEELHLVGTETNDCVFATALEGSDLGYMVYVIEECCEAAAKGRHKPAVKLLRYQYMTNNCCLDKTLEVD